MISLGQFGLKNAEKNWKIHVQSSSKRNIIPCPRETTDNSLIQLFQLISSFFWPLNEIFWEDKIQNENVLLCGC